MWKGCIFDVVQKDNLFLWKKTISKSCFNVSKFGRIPNEKIKFPQRRRLSLHKDNEQLYRGIYGLKPKPLIGHRLLRHIMEPDLRPYPLKNSPQYKRRGMKNPNTEFRNKIYMEKAKKRSDRKLSEGTVRSSNGDITIDLDNGSILDVHSKSIGFKSWTRHILRFNLDEYREFYHDYDCKDTSFDILDLGYWEVTGRYVPPSKGFREAIARDYGEDGF